MTVAEYDVFITSPFADETIAGDDRAGLVIVRGEADHLTCPGSLPIVVAWAGDELGGVGPPEADVVIDRLDPNSILRAVEAAPIAAATLAVLLRGSAHRSVEEGLAAESAAYSLLQAGPEFASWRANDPHGMDDVSDPVVASERAGDELIVTLDRPHRHNAITARLRDELSAALALAVVDDSITSVVLRGSGASFCSGGDLGEFGRRPDPATSHVTRLARSPARLIHRLRDRISVQVHGATMGGGIEMAAFAGRVVAAPDTLFALPEISLGLVPGAGGTVSLTARIGRQRTAALAFTGKVIDVHTALAWGLIDEIAPAPA